MAQQRPPQNQQQQQQGDNQELQGPKREVNLLNTGLNLDAAKYALKPGEYCYALNSFIVSPKGDTIQNEESNALYQVLPTGKENLSIIGSINILESMVVFLTDNVESEIGIFDKYGHYTTVVNNPCLNFNLENQVQGEARTDNTSCGRTIYWCDNFRNPMRYLDIDNVPVPFDCDKIRIFPIVGNPCVQITGITEFGSGQLFTGAYQFAIQYADIDGNPLTGYYGMTDVVPIYKDSISGSWQTISGDPTGIPTDKAIVLEFDNLSTQFATYNIAVIKTIGGVVTTAIAANQSTSSPNTFTYSGIDSADPVTLDTILTKPTIYTGAKTVTQAIRKLIWGNLKGNNIYNFQQYANQIQTYWQTYRIKYDDLAKDYKQPLSTAYRKSFMRDEVIPLGVVLRFTDGSESCVYHIPGRAKDYYSDGVNKIPFTLDQYGQPVTANEWDSSNAPTNSDNYDTVTQRWQVYNTATLIGVDSCYDEANNVGWKDYGECSYYETQDGRYPNIPDVWGNLANQPIRHHKMPDGSISPITGFNGTDHAQTDGNYLTSGGTVIDQTSFLTDWNVETRIDLLGLKFPNLNTIINQAVTDGIIPAGVIAGWDIVRADRTNEKTILAKGLFYNVREYQNINNAVTRAFPNYPYNALTTDFLYENGSYNSEHFAYDLYTFESPSTSFSHPVLGVSELKWENNVFGPSISNWEGARDQVADISGDSFFEAPALVSLSQSKYNYCINNTYNNVRRKLKQCVYVSANTLQAEQPDLLDINNINGASTVYLGTTTTLSSPIRTEGDNRLPISVVYDLDSPTGRPNSDFSYYYTRTSSFYGSIKNNNPSVYSDLEDIEYIKIPTNCDNSDSCQNLLDPVKVLGGDTFITFYATKRKHSFFNTYTNTNPLQYAFSTGNWRIDRPLTWLTTNNSGTVDGGSDINGFNKSSGDSGGDLLFFYYTLVTGVPGYWVESEINTELRYDLGTPATQYYPNVVNCGSIPPSFPCFQIWLNRSLTTDISYISEDSPWLYNFDYSTQNDKHQFCIYPNSTDFKDTCVTSYPQREIWSETANNEQVYDTYLQYLPLSYFDYSKEDGEIWSIFNSEELLFTRMVNGTYKLQLAPSELSTNQELVNITSGTIFNVPPVKLEETDNGYGGTQSQWAVNDTPFGIFMADENAGKVFKIAIRYFNSGYAMPSLSLSGRYKLMAEISANDTFFFFRDNLQPALKNQVNGILGDGTYTLFDNPANPYGTGLLSAWDSRYNRWILTKKDFLLKNPQDLINGNITFDGHNFRDSTQQRNIIPFSDTDVFCNKSFTISFHPEKERWISFHSYLPNYYISQKSDFYSWINNNLETAGGWRHNTDCTYMTYYGQEYPYIVEFPTKLNGADTYTEPGLSWVQYTYKCVAGTTEAISNLQTTFNKAYIYNDDEHSGNLNLKFQNLEDLSTILDLPTTETNSIDIQISKREKLYSFSAFTDHYRHDSGLPMNTDNCSNTDYLAAFPIDQVVNNDAIEYDRNWYNLQRFRGQYCTARLILDNVHDVKLINTFFFNIPKLSY